MSKTNPPEGHYVTVVVVHEVFVPLGVRIEERVLAELNYCAATIQTATWNEVGPEEFNGLRVFAHDEGRWAELST